MTRSVELPSSPKGLVTCFADSLRTNRPPPVAERPTPTWTPLFLNRLPKAFEIEEKIEGAEADAVLTNGVTKVTAISVASYLSLKQIEL